MNPRILSACYRSPYLGMAALQGQKVLEVRRHRLRKQGAKAVAREHIAALAEAYGARTVVVELGTLPHRAVKARMRLTVRLHTLKQVKDHVLSDAEVKTTAGLVAQLLRQRPDLRRLTENHRTGKLASTRDQWAIVNLLALALGLHEAGWHKP